MSLNMIVENVSMRYGESSVLKSVGAEFSPGVTALMGPNGSGKSTLLRICALIEEPTAGSVRFMEEGSELPHEMSLRRRVTMVLSRGGIFNSSVCSNAAYGLRLRGLKGAELRERTHAILQRVGLLDKTKQNARSLSAGETQRLALARAMVIGPDVLLLDEPTASVDEDNSVIIEGLISGLKQPGGPLVIMATHDRQQAERLSDRVITLRKGKIEG
jgi:tungstate transport system ATP-binding protein